MDFIVTMLDGFGTLDDYYAGLENNYGIKDEDLSKLYP